MRVKEKMHFLRMRLYVFLSAFSKIRKLKVSYLLSKHPSRYNRKSLNELKWEIDGVLFKESNFLLRTPFINTIGADFNTFQKLLKIGKCEYIDDKLVFTTNKSVESQVSMIISNADIIWLIWSLYIDGEYNLKEFQTENYTVIDVGMNVALASLYFASFNNINKVYGFEPLPVNYELAKSNLVLNSSLSEVIIPNNFGLAAKESILEIDYFAGGDLGFSTTDFVREKKIQIGGKGKKTTTITLKSVGEEFWKILDKNPGSNLLVKLDCEGAEYEILEALDKENLLRYVRLIFIEWHYKGAEPLITLLKNNNFIILTSITHSNNYTGIIKAEQND